VIELICEFVEVINQISQVEAVSNVISHKMIVVAEVRLGEFKGQCRFSDVDRSQLDFEIEDSSELFQVAFFMIDVVGVHEDRDWNLMSLEWCNWKRGENRRLVSFAGKSSSRNLTDLLGRFIFDVGFLLVVGSGQVDLVWPKGRRCEKLGVDSARFDIEQLERSLAVGRIDFDVNFNLSIDDN
jgi:hypothetical protein